RALAFAAGQDDERVRRRFHPRFGVDDDSAAAFLLGDEDAVEADVEDANAVGQAAHVEGDAAFVSVAALDLDQQARLLAGYDAHLGLARRGDEVAGFDNLG